MLTEYIKAGMRRARYEILEDSSYYGEIPGVQGVYANADSLEACRDELESVFDDWVLLSLRAGDELPSIDGVDLNVARSA